MRIDENQILELLTDHHSPRAWMNRQLGAQLAGQHRLLKAERLLTLLLGDQMEWVRYHAFCALIALDTPPSRLKPLALELIKDPFFRLRQSARDYLDELAHAPPKAANT